MTKHDSFMIHRIFRTLMVISLVFGLGFFVTNNLDFLINAITYGQATLPNIAYWLSKIVGPILIPLVFLLPSVALFERIRMVKYTFIAYGILQIITFFWVFWYFGENGFGGFLSNDAISAFQSAKDNSFVASLVYWDTYSWLGNIATLLYASLCIYLGLCFDEHKDKVCKLVLFVAVLRILIPISLNLISGNGFLSSFWITNNYADAIALGFVAAAMFMAKVQDETWIYLVWDQEIPRDDEEAPF